MSAADSDDDWYDKDEEELLQNLENKLQTADATVEYIRGPTYLVDEHLQAQRLAAAAKATSATKVPRIHISELRKLATAPALETFLFAFTHAPANFFASQVLPNDSQERVLLYLRSFASICSLRLPGFHTELLRHFAENEDFLDQLQLITTKIFAQSHAYSENLKVETQILSDLHLLCVEAQTENVFSDKYRSMLHHMHKLFKSNQNMNKIAELSIYQKFSKLLQVFNEERNGKNETQTVLDEIYPTLQELLQEAEPIKPLTPIDSDVRAYIEQQKFILHNDFLYSLRACVHALRTGSELPTQLLLLEPVTIVYNEQFESAQRHELVFVDLLAGNRSDANATIKPAMRLNISRLKSGTLLCFSTSRAFDNLILATFNYTEQEVLVGGYLGIEVVRQYNMGNIYNKPLLMFEAPAFFEPYNQVYKSLRHTRDELPFQNYLLAKENVVQAPLYLRNQQHISYTFEGCRLEPNGVLPAEALQLNAAQLKAYQNALTQELCLIHGPPGTGKTHMSVKLVRTLMENATHTPVVLITYTNESLDKFLLKLSEHTQDILRFGKRSRLPEISAMTTKEQEDDQLLMPRLKQLHYLTNIELKQRFKYLQQLQQEFDGTDEHYERIVAAQRLVSTVEQKLNCLRIIFQYCLASEKRLIAMTTSCAAKMNLIFHLLKSAIVIFEEAAEILESHVVACITSHTQHIIMIGDHKQLQPYTSSQKLSIAWGLNVSLFERLIKQGLPYAGLNIQYRMCANIAQLLTPLIYKQLENADCIKNYAAVRKMRQNLYFMSHQEPETQSNDETSLCNEFEATQLVNLAEYLFNKAEYGANDFVILSPYAKQVELIRRKLQCSAATLHAIRVSTVDSFQGLEANIILLSLVRSNKQQIIGFLMNKRRICVALSRARIGLYIIGDLDFLATNSNTWNAIKANLKQQNAVGSQFPFEEVET